MQMQLSRRSILVASAVLPAIAHASLTLAEEAAMAKKSYFSVIRYSTTAPMSRVVQTSWSNLFTACLMAGLPCY